MTAPNETDNPPVAIVKVKPKRIKPRKAVRSFNFRLGKWQIIVQIWRYRPLKNQDWKNEPH
jgi:hypothetical protein